MKFVLTCAQELVSICLTEQAVEDGFVRRWIRLTCPVLSLPFPVD